MSQDLVVFNEEKIALIKEMFCKNATKAEFELFIQMAKKLDLDPICKQIYFIKFGDKMTIVVGIDGYRSIAERTGMYMPGREPTFVYDKAGNLLSATAYVKKWSDRDRQWHEVGATAMLAEYDTGKNQWVKGKHFMLAKTAESLALRKAFPTFLAGTNTQEEMDKVIDIESNARPHNKPQELTIKPKMMSSQDAVKIMDIIGDDAEYVAKILNHYNVKGLGEIPESEVNIIVERATVYSQKRLDMEMANA
jgi:phage recombination protein Bet